MPLTVTIAGTCSPSVLNTSVTLFQPAVIATECMGIHLQPKLVDVAGDLASGVLLSQVVYWFSAGNDGKIRVNCERDGKLWWVQRRKDIQTVTGLSEWNLRKALKNLKDRGIISTEVHTYGCVPETYIHLHVEALDKALRDRANGEGLHKQMETASNRKWSTSSKPYKKTSVENSEKTSAPTSGATTACTPTPLPVGMIDTAPDNVVKRETGNFMATVSEILKHKRDMADASSAASGVRALQILWKKRMGQTYGGFQKDMTQEDLGKLKMFATKCGGRAGEALDWALQNWGELAFEARQRYGLSVAPERPVVGFLLKYHDVVIDLLQSVAQKKVQHHEQAVVASPTTAPTSGPKSQESVQQKVTPAQVAAALAKFKSG